MIFAGYILYKDFEIAATYRNAVSSIKTRGFETLKDPEVYLELHQTIKMEIFKKIVNDWKTLTILVKKLRLRCSGFCICLWDYEDSKNRFKEMITYLSFLVYSIFFFFSFFACSYSCPIKCSKHFFLFARFNKSLSLWKPSFFY